MSEVEERTVRLPIEQARYVDELVKSGSYASPSEVVQAGLRALQDRDVGVERWLRDEVVAIYDAMQADPARGRSPEQVIASIRGRYSERVKSEKRDA